jgi:hypothetical protein
MIGFVYSYYNNLQMLQRQITEWTLYPEEIQKQLSICITDDCSEIPIPLFLNYPKNIKTSIYKIEKKVAWNWLACRNIGAFELNTKWLFITDMDHLMSKESMIQLMNQIKGLNTNLIYFFTREHASNHFPIGGHTNSYLMTREMYWKVGGHDEKYAGIYYGTTREFQKRAFSKAEGQRILNIPLSLFFTDDINDACTKELPRNKEKDQILMTKILRKKQKIKVLSFPYKKLK